MDGRIRQGRCDTVLNTGSPHLSLLPLSVHRLSSVFLWVGSGLPLVPIMTGTGSGVSVSQSVT